MSGRRRVQASNRVGVSTNGSPYRSNVRQKLADKKSPTRLSGKQDDPLLTAGSLFPKLPQMPSYEKLVTPNRRFSIRPEDEVDNSSFLRGPKDYTDFSVEPKVFAGWKSNDVPREKLVAARAKEFQCTDYAELLMERGLADGNPERADSVIPVEVFYDGSSDMFQDPEGWIAKGTSGGVCSLPARGWREGMGWCECRVTGWDTELSTYTLMWVHDNASGNLARHLLVFFCENPHDAADRLVNALRARDKAERQIQYNLYVSCMPQDEMENRDEEQECRILSDAMNDDAMLAANLDSEPLIQEVNQEFVRVQNQVIFDDNLNLPHQASLKSKLRQPGDVPVAPPVPYSSVLDIPEHDFAEQCAQFAEESLVIDVDVVMALQKVGYHCSDILKQSLFRSSHEKSLRKDEFETAQSSQLKETMSYIKDQWAPSIVSDVKTTLAETRPDWFNFGETNHEVYATSRLRRLVKQINYKMEDAMRLMEEASVNAFVIAVKNSAVGKDVKIDNTCASTVTLREGFPEHLMSQPPLFTLDLAINQEGEGEESKFKVGCNVDLGTFAQAIVNVLETGLKTPQSVHQIESQVMNRMFWPRKACLSLVDLTEPLIVESIKTLTDSISEGIQPTLKYIEMYQQYNSFLNLDIDEVIKGMSENEDTALSEIVSWIDKHAAAKLEVEASIPTESIDLGLVAINCNQVRTKLIEKHVEVVAKMQKLISDLANARSATIIREYTTVFDQVGVKPRDIESLSEIRQTIKNIPATTEALENKVAEVREFFEALDNSNFLQESLDFNRRIESISWAAKLQRAVDLALQGLDKNERTFHDSLMGFQENFVEEIEEITRDIEAFVECTDFEKVKEMAATAKIIGNKLSEMDATSKKINARECLFGDTPTEYDDVATNTKKFQVYGDLWTNAASWLEWNDTWLNGPLQNLNFEEVRTSFEASSKIMKKASRVFKDSSPAHSDIASNIKEEMEVFNDKTCGLELVEALRNPGMKERHWDELSEKVGADIHPDENFTLQMAIDMGLGGKEQIEIVSTVSNVATKQFGIENQLQNMEAEWASVDATISEYKETGTFVLKQSDDILTILDDHIVQVQAMSFSPFKGPFEEAIATWERDLCLLQEVIGEWLLLQRNWMYLEPIFSSDDINRQLPQEGKRFAQSNKFWRKHMANAAKNPHALGFADQELFEKVKEFNAMLDRVQKNLAEYLETKRAAFGRFYFLSDEDLIQILSQTKDPLAVQKHLDKCFEAIQLLTFEGERKKKNLRITAMHSPQKETIQFIEDVPPEGQVEFWLGEVELMMRKSVRDQFEQAILCYKETDRKQWVQNYPGMVVLNGSQVFWTAECEEALNTAGCEGLGKYLNETLLSQLNGLVEIVRGKINKLTSITMGALITIDVHARDVIDAMVQNGISNTQEFEWVQQLRYYWEHYGIMSAPTEDTGFNEMVVKQVQCKFPYGYEYLGNSFRLVITPLTDRCYMTLMGAIHLNLGGAPAGPAGTGKTESTKDLAKALAMQCVVFNCSDGLDYKAMEKFFKGLAMSGAWACFDEFNRIDIEVLSVIAQQILDIQVAVKQGLTRFNFQGTEISLINTCNVYITMNPGYAGRTELPDNLKALFRPVAMMVPDYALIAQVRLYSFGFSAAKPLSVKLVATFKLSSEQLSSQDHYDFGMRAVNAAIVASGNLKRKFPDTNEDELLLQALRDVNKPKFLAQDLLLFLGIIKDLFPGVEEPKSEYPQLEAEMAIACAEYTWDKMHYHLQFVEGFKQKMVQLYETTVVRHGLMVVGPTGSGKTCISRCLANAQTACHAKEIPGFEPTRIFALNPKSITLNQLYGTFDLATGEWTDGIGADLFRHASAPDEECGVAPDDKKWVYFDGPVDAIWIESMNTVLDDNKKLCLVSGEMIKMSDGMTMMFEPEDLAVASPATVSRCGMIFVEPEYLCPSEDSPASDSPLCKAWLERLPPNLQTHKATYSNLLNGWLWDVLYHLRKNLKEVVPTVTTNVIPSLFKILDCFHEKFINKEGYTVAEDALENLPALIEPFFSFALVWSLGCTCIGEDRPKMDEKLREVMESNNAALPFPKEGTIYDYQLDQSTVSWVGWLETQPAYELDNSAAFSDKIVPTKDSISYTYMVKTLCENHHHVLAVGDTGTGKSVTVARCLKYSLEQNFDAIITGFSAQTSANMTQDIIDDKFDKRRQGKKDGLEFLMHGPPIGKYSVIFVDDMNMPKREEYGAQPPIELLRQWMDHQGWYDRKIRRFKYTVDVGFVGAMGPPGGGRQVVTNRFLRHFNFVGFTPMQDASLYMLFSTILDGHFKSGNFAEEVQSLTKPIIDMSITLYNKILEQLLPTPAKSHYTFNLRDLSKVVQGLLNSTNKKINEKDVFLRLWIHESSRVFCDRLVNSEDRDLFYGIVTEQLQEKCNVDMQKLLVADRLVFGDYTEGQAADPKLYTEIQDMTQLRTMIDGYLEEYDSESKQPMRLVLFMDAIEHVSRINRILRLALGNALLCGVGGSGRKSLTKLAAYMTDYKVFMIEIAKNYGITEWREDLKTVMRHTGLTNQPMVFLFDDTQVVDEGFLEDINNILNSGEVPNMWKEEEVGEIFTAMTPILAGRGAVVNKLNLMSEFVSRCKSNLHLVICMSPIGDDFVSRLRKFPSLVNCCTIDWFNEWPYEALKSVARDKNVETEFDSDEIRDVTYEMFVFIHQSVERKAKLYLEQLRRFCYVTPTSYLELLNIFQGILKEKVGNLQQQIRRLDGGLRKIDAAESLVDVLKVQLAEAMPVLVQTQKEVSEFMVQITADKEEAEVIAQEAGVVEADAMEKKTTAEGIAAKAQGKLDKALPALYAALENVDKLQKKDIDEMKALGNPPARVKKVMAAVCIYHKEKPTKVPDPDNPKKKIDDYWKQSQGLLRDAKAFIASLKGFDKDNIPEDVINKITPFYEDEDLEVDKVKSTSQVAFPIMLWVNAMYDYHFVSKEVEPLRQEAAAAQTVLDEAMTQLAAAQAKLKAVQERLATLEAQYKESVDKKDKLEADVENTNLKLSRADKLLGGLGGERAQWKITVKDLKVLKDNIVGNVLVGAGGVAYLGIFTALFRKDLVNEWQAKLKELGVPTHFETADVRGTLEEAVKVRSWNIDGLPSDNLSIENGIMIDKARRWPLCIDPQRQANKWIKNMEAEGLGSDGVIRASDNSSKLTRALETAVRFGRPLLLENVLESLDPMLEPILLRQTFKQGGTDMIKLGDSVIAYDHNFKFYLTTNLRNPHYTPEVAVKVSVLNFMITPDGLEEQLLGALVAVERPDCEQKKNELVVNNARMKKELKEIEDQILALLDQSGDDILDEDTLINALAESGAMKTEITAKMEEAAITEKEIDAAREEYRPCAYRSQLLFFCVADMGSVDPMYQYSLGWFRVVFRASLENSEPHKEVDKRLDNINKHFTYSLYDNVCRGLFEQHKLLFSFTLTVKLLQGYDKMDPIQWRFLLAGPSGTDTKHPKPNVDWLTEASWIEISKLSEVEGFQGLDESLIANTDAFRAYFDLTDPERHPAPLDWNGKWGTFQKVVFLRAIRPDRMVLKVSEYVEEEMGKEFITPPVFSLDKSYGDASNTMPLIFILSAGADPVAELLSFADAQGMGNKTKYISLGQGQDKKAEALLAEGVKFGWWVLLQNCHLFKSWMPVLEKTIEAFTADGNHKEFRLWLTSLPSPHFPVSVLENGVKMVNEPPAGFKANMNRVYATMDEDYLDSSSKPAQWKKTLFSLSMFHAIVMERRKYGALGYNIRYGFTDGDGHVGKMQSLNLLDDYDRLPIKVVRTLVTDINYGGRVTDDWDRRAMSAMVKDFVSDDMLDLDTCPFSPSGTYHTIPVEGKNDDGSERGTIADTLKYIDTLPGDAAPELFGFHDNAAITYASNEQRILCSTVLSLQPRASAGAGKSREDTIDEMAVDILSRVPGPYDLEPIQKAYPVCYEQSMNTVLQQEVVRYNKLLKEMKSSNASIRKALVGQLVMTEELDKMATAMFNQQVPANWEKKAYPSLKPLAAWVNDLLARLDFLNKWIEFGCPAAYWISGFFFPQAFLTGTLQNYARKYQYPIDRIDFTTKVLKVKDQTEIATGPEDGCYIYGLFLEGCRWDASAHLLCESNPKELYTTMAPMHLEPMMDRTWKVSPLVNSRDGFFICPVYKTLVRAGTLSTTGHSTNFVIALEVPSDKPGDHWIKRGVALFTGLMY